MKLIGSEIEAMMYIFESVNEDGVIKEYSHAKMEKTFGMPFQSYMQAVNGLIEKRLVQIEDQQLRVVGYVDAIKNYGYIRLPWHFVMKAFRTKTTRPDRLICYLLGRLIYKSSNDISKPFVPGRKENFKEDTLCELFNFMPCELKQYINILIQKKYIEATYDAESESYIISLHKNIIKSYNNAEDVFKDAQRSGGELFKSITAKIRQLLNIAKAIDKIKTTDVISIINLAITHGYSAIFDTILVLYEYWISKDKMPDNLIGWITKGCQNIKSRLVVA
jgi:hypothetical protein